MRVSYSLLSAGTEAATVATARKSMLGKAKERPDQAIQVAHAAAQQGPLQAYRAVMKRLEAYSPVGYSCAGEVIELAKDVRGFCIGDHVACAGVGYANHADVVAVPENLSVKLQQDADLKLAAYNTLGAIALQGVRQAELRLGESCAVIGLGLLGQLTCLLLRASGVHVYGIDIDTWAVEMAGRHAADRAWLRDEPGLENHLVSFTKGLGVDGVIITAGTSSLDPINFAGRIARQRGRVVVVGDVPTGFAREMYYRKELEVRMSCSYGPGRYDPNYEEKGIDYPAAYVRWTEKRNMEAFQELVHSGRIDLSYLTTHEYTLEDAPKAYDMILGKQEPYLGIVIRYDRDHQVKPATSFEIRTPLPAGQVNVSFIGAGSYAQGSLLPNLPKDQRVVRRGVLTATGTTSRRVAERFGFEFCTGAVEDILGSGTVDTDTVFIATRHDSHAKFVAAALRAGKHVFVEKPLALTEEQLEDVEAAFFEATNRFPVQLMVGFNRRFAPLVEALRAKTGDGPLSMLYRVNAGSLPADSWIQDPEVGCGRVIGEACHFIDLMTFFAGAPPASVHAQAIRDAQGFLDTVHLNLGFQDGSVGTVAYLANGSDALYKEHFEVAWHGCSAVLRDFKRLEIYTRKRDVVRRPFPDKGQKEMLRRFVVAVAEGGEAPIPPADIFAATRATFAAMESLRTGLAVPV